MIATYESAMNGTVRRVNERETRICDDASKGCYGVGTHARNNNTLIVCCNGLLHCSLLTLRCCLRKLYTHRGSSGTSRSNRNNNNTVRATFINGQQNVRWRITIVENAKCSLRCALSDAVGLQNAMVQMHVIQTR